MVKPTHPINPLRARREYLEREGRRYTRSSPVAHAAKRDDDAPKSFLYPGGRRYQTVGVEPSMSVTEAREVVTQLLGDTDEFLRMMAPGKVAQAARRIPFSGLPVVENVTGTVFPCTECYEEFRSAAAWEIHMVTKHTPKVSEEADD